MPPAVPEMHRRSLLCFQLLAGDCSGIVRPKKFHPRFQFRCRLHRKIEAWFFTFNRVYISRFNYDYSNTRLRARVYKRYDFEDGVRRGHTAITISCILHSYNSVHMCIYYTIIDSVTAHERGDCKMASRAACGWSVLNSAFWKRPARKWNGRG